MASELGFCVHLLEKFLKFWETNKAPYLEIFLDPVDEAEDHAPGYYAMISSPMDLATMATKLEAGAYADAQAFEKDFYLMIQNCHTYNHGNPNFVKKYADRFVKEFEWEWSEMGRWMSTTRRKLAREAAAASTSAPSTDTRTSGDEIISLPRSSASDAEPESSSRPSPSPSLGSPQGNGMATSRPSASNIASASERGLRVNDSSEDAVDVAVAALRGIMTEQIAVVAAEKDQMAASTLALWGKIWGPERRQISNEMWRAKCFSKITREEWPGSVAAIRVEVLQAWAETVTEQLALVEQEEEAAKAAERAEFLRQLDFDAAPNGSLDASDDLDSLEEKLSAFTRRCTSCSPQAERPGLFTLLRHLLPQKQPSSSPFVLRRGQSPTDALTSKHSVAMPPKQFNTKASKVHSDSTYEDSEPEPQPLRKPRITLKRGKSVLNMNEIDVPIHTRTVTKKPSQDEIYKDLLSRPSANQPLQDQISRSATSKTPQDQIYKDLLSRPVVKEPAPKRQRVSSASPSPAAIAAPASSATIASKSHQDLFNDYTKDLLSQEIEKQAKSLDFSSDSDLSDKARVYGRYLFTAPYQFERTKSTWINRAMERVDKMSMAELRNGGIEKAVKDALIQTIGDETKNQAVLFGQNARDIIRLLKKEDGDKQ
ncbi:hypothetical protein KCU95_g179, partial [Aureobasidium melanogenum]